MGLTDITTLDQSEPESNGNKGVLHTSQTSRTGAFTTRQSFISYPKYISFSIGESYPTAKIVVAIFYTMNKVTRTFDIC